MSAFNGPAPLIVHYAGDEGLERVFARQSIPLELLDTLELIFLTLSPASRCTLS